MKYPFTLSALRKTPLLITLVLLLFGMPLSIALAADEPAQQIVVSSKMDPYSAVGYEAACVAFSKNPC